MILMPVIMLKEAICLPASNKSVGEFLECEGEGSSIVALTQLGGVRVNVFVETRVKISCVTNELTKMKIRFFEKQ